MIVFICHGFLKEVYDILNHVNFYNMNTNLKVRITCTVLFKYEFQTVKI